MQAKYINVQKKSTLAKSNLVPVLPVTDPELLLLMPVSAKSIRFYSHTIAAVVQVGNPRFFDPITEEDYQEIADICGMSKLAVKIKHRKILKGEPLVVYPIVKVSMPQELRFLGTFAGQLQRLNYVDARDLNTLPVAPIARPQGANGQVGLILSHQISLGKDNWVALRTHMLSKFNKTVVKEFNCALLRK